MARLSHVHQMHGQNELVSTKLTILIDICQAPVYKLYSNVSIMMTSLEYESSICFCLVSWGLLKFNVKNKTEKS